MIEWGFQESNFDESRKVNLEKSDDLTYYYFWIIIIIIRIFWILNMKR